MEKEKNDEVIKEVDKKISKKKKENKTSDDKFIIDTVSKIRKIINELHKRADKIKEHNIGVFVDLIAFNSKTKKPLDGFSFGLGVSIVDELKYIESVKCARMLRITDGVIDKVSEEIKKRRGIIKKC